MEYHHFKIENRKSVIICISPNCYMASIDLKDAYHSVSIGGPNHRKYLRFKLKNQSSFVFLTMFWEHLNRHQSFQFTCLPNGLSAVLQEYSQNFWNQHILFYGAKVWKRGIYWWHLSQREQLFWLWNKCIYHCQVIYRLGSDLNMAKSSLYQVRSSLFGALY